ncbi:restriction endonuclease subunit S [Prevotella copri]|uniref:restriction endonuclease subunit S n=1 Tax=Segatella copri TaxID=165179 RepID=UPI001C390EAE|nr:restriction endonuclease subunit S [Segatella copri]MBV3445264.1 restriction endonuclease subunit S [Segatella copri]
MEWKELQTLVKRKIGYGIVQPGPSVQKGVPIIKVNNIISGLYDTKHLDKTTVENDAKYQRTKLKGGELIVTVVGTCGKTAIVPPQFVGCNLVRATCLIDIEDETICRWIKYYIDSPQGQAYINRNLNTTVQATLNVKNLNEMPIPFYSKEYTSNVVKILSSLDRKIELNNKINADLEEMAQAIFKNWFVDFEPFKNGKFVDSELGMIPEGWKVGRLGDITKNKSAKVKERNDVKVLSPVTTGELVLSEEYFTKQVFSSSIAKYKIVNKGDFAYNPARVNIGSLGRNEFDFDGCVSPVYVVFSVLDGYENYFDLFRKTDFFKDSVASLAIGGVRQSLSYDDLSSIEVIIPSENAVEEFNNLYNQMKKTIKANKLENSRLSTLRDTLLPRLMSGEIEVPE